MIQKNSQVVPVDKCGVWLIRVFHVYGKLRKTSIIGDFVKSSIRQTKPNNWLRKKKKIKSIVVVSAQIYQVFGGNSYRISRNSCMMLKKRLTPRGSKVRGPIDNRVRRKRARASFIKVI